jgi:hypothetical protein
MFMYGEDADPDRRARRQDWQWPVTAERRGGMLAWFRWRRAQITG